MGTAQLMEKEFETNVCEEMASHGWIYDNDNTGWDIELAMYRPDVIAWLQSQYPDDYANAVAPELSGMSRTNAENKLLQRLSQEMNKTPIINRTSGTIAGGLLGVLRSGFSHAQMGRPSAKFGGMVAFQPSNPQIKGEISRASHNRLRVLRQVRFDTSSNHTIDLVLTVNGIPVVTMELKTDNTQTVHHAIAQYREDRKPNKKRTLLTPGRVLVHFAVSNDEVHMTTVLNGKDTRFLPFNQGNEGRAGNPSSDTGSATNYLWNQVLSPDTLLRILRDYALWEPDKKNPSKGFLIFPRFHQLRAVERVMNDVAEIGSGGRYLIQHSAGSGKTKTITWLAQRLSKYFNDEGQKVFNSVIIVSDRTVLDRNITESLELLQASEGSIVYVDNLGGSKSKKLREALIKGNRIISCTIQTFPALAKNIEKLNQEEAEEYGEASERPAGRNYAVIIDEAHSSQHGETANKLKETLVDIDDEDGTLTGDDLIAATDSAIANPSNLSFVALTATPKGKTVTEYGVPDPDDPTRKIPFDTYMMAQAIDEGFILDVLKQYSTYQMFARVRNEIGREDKVDLGDAVADMVRFVRLHPTSIAQKVEVVVEHFRRNVMNLMDGDAKAMVITADRRSAFHWSQSMNEYIAEKEYEDMATLVAFSGSLNVAKDGSDEEINVTEASLNGRGDTESAFKEDDVNKVLIVANKFQTGFDEPRLCAMYVDKSLSGVMSVQTLSRLNRIAENKPDPMVVDFVNDPEKIVESFRPYYQEAHIDQEVDPNKIHDLAQKLDASEFYTWEQVEAVTEAFHSGASGERLQSLISPIKNRWRGRYRQAVVKNNEEDKKTVLDFRKNLEVYKKAWEFLSQIVDFQDVSLHKRAILAALLYRNLHLDNTPDGADNLSGVALLGMALDPTSANENLQLDDSDVTDDGGLGIPGFDGRSHGFGTAVKSAFDHAVEKVNEIFSAHGIDLSEGTSMGMMRKVWGILSDDDAIKHLTSENSPEQLAGSTQFANQVVNALLGAVGELQKEPEDFAATLLSDQELMERFVRGLAEVSVAALYQENIQAIISGDAPNTTEASGA